MTECQNHEPEVPFSGSFAFDWEQRKLGELSEPLMYGLNAASTDFDGINKYIRITDIDDETRMFKMDGLTSPVFQPNESEKYKLELGDLLFARTGASVGKTYIYKASDGLVYFAGFLIRARIKPDYVADFVFQNTLTEQYKQFIQITSQRSGQPGVNAQEYESYSFLVPNKQEQKLIGTFFNQMDNLITLHQRKYDKLVSVKKSMLEKMFPKNGSNIPEIRFSGFTDPWEQRKLLQISDKVTEKNSSREYSETFTNSAEFGIISQREFFDKDISNEENIDGYYIVKNDDFVYNPRISTFAPVGPIKRNKLGRDGVMSPLYYAFRTHDIDPTYLEHFFTTTGWHKFMKLNGDSGARSDRFSIKDSVFREMPLPYPSIDEQEKIGEFFDVITNLITLHQREPNYLMEEKDVT